MNKMMITGALAAVLVAGGAYTFMNGSGEAVASETAQFELDKTEPLPDILLGNPDAKVTIVEYANYTCGYCGKFYTEVYPELKKEYVDTGKVNIVHREIITDGVGLTGVLAARCLPDDKYYGMAELLYKNQDVWAYGKESMEEVRAAIGKYAALAGLGGDEFQQCFTGMAEDSTEEERARLEAMLKLAGDRATADKITGTPSILVNGKQVEKWDWQSLKPEIEKALQAQN